MDNEINIRKYQPGDEEKIVEFLKLAFEGWPHFDLECSSLDHWKWKFNGQAEKARTTLAEVDNKIVGCDHALYTKIKIGDEIYPCRQAVDSAVHPNYRGSGIYSKMRAYDIKNAQKITYPEYVSFYASSNKIIIKKEDKMGYNNFPYQITPMVRILNVDSHPLKDSYEKQLFIKTRYKTLKRFNQLVNYPLKTKTTNSKLKIEEVTEFDERIEPFWDAIKSHYSFISERSREYFKWRYCDHRGGKYAIKQAEENGEIIGYVVLRVNKYDADHPRGYIVDLCTLQRRPDCVDELISESLKYFDVKKINCVDYYTIKGHTYQKHMNKFGFLDSRYKIHVAYLQKKTVPGLNDFINAPPSKILFQYNDIDWI